ncbi:MAG: response regulator transcription factor [Chromatiales bacterium]|nr:MAG: response regulator transcription factor [Chromatiales bacterium]
MRTMQDQQIIRVLVADDDERVLECYREAFGDEEQTNQMRALDALAAELFDTTKDLQDQPRFEIVACSQGRDAIRAAEAARIEGAPFDVVILDIRMPPGIDGVEAGSQIRKQDPDVEIIFVTGYSDLPFTELQRRIPPPMHLHYFHKPLSFKQLAEDVVSMVRTQ